MSFKGPISIQDLKLRGGFPVHTGDSASYNGWKTSQGQRGGHLREAKIISAQWVPGMSPIHWRELLLRNGLSAQTALGLYGCDHDIEVVCEFLKSKGFEEIYFLNTVDQELLEFHSLSLYEKLVPVRWLTELINHRPVEAPPLPNWAIFEVFDETENFNSHDSIPGSRPLPLEKLEEPPIWNKRSDAELEENILALGIQSSMTVILYSRNTIRAARAAHLLMYAGIKDIRLLDGGLSAYIQHKPFSKKNTHNADHKFSYAKKMAHPFLSAPEIYANLEQAKKFSQMPDSHTLVSVRAWEEFIGETSGYSHIKAKGDIPGARWGHAGSDAMNMESYRNFDNTMRSYEDIESFWREQGIEPEKHLIFYCGTGWRASEAFLYAYLMGWKNISVFDGGWKQWSETLGGNLI